MTVKLDTQLFASTGDPREICVGLHELLHGRPPANLLSPEHLWWETTAASDIIQAMLNEAQEKAPSGYFFGPNPLWPDQWGYWKSDKYGEPHAS